MNVPAAPCAFIFGIDMPTAAGAAAETGAAAGTGAGADTSADDIFGGGPCLLVKSFDTASILFTS